MNAVTHRRRCVYVCRFHRSTLPVSSDPVTVSQAPPGSLLDDTPDLIVSQEVLEKLLARDDLLSPRQHLQMYASPLNISMDAGERRLPFSGVTKHPGLEKLHD